MSDDVEMIEKWKYDLGHFIWEKDHEMWKKDQDIKALALEKAVRTIYLEKKDDFEVCLWEIIEILGEEEAITFLKQNKKLAYYIYCQGK